MTSNRQILQNWDEFRRNLLADTAIDKNKSAADILKHRKQIEADIIEWIIFFFQPKYPFAKFHKRFFRRVEKAVSAGKNWFEVLSWARELAKTTCVMYIMLLPVEEYDIQANRNTLKQAIELVNEGRRRDAMQILGGMYYANYDRAVKTVYGNPDIGQDGYGHVMQFRANFGRMAFYKAAQLVNELAEQVKENDYDKKAADTGKRYNRYQAAEYNTAVARSRTAKQFEGFKSEASLYPNIEWLRTRSSTPREAHLAYVGLVLPRDNPFWKQNQPGNLYGCKCDWRTTDAGTSTEPLSYVPPAQGLDGNPGETGEIFTKRHPYFEHADTAKVNNAIAQLPPESTYRTIYGVDKKQVRYNIMHSRDAIAKNAEVANDLLKLGYDRIDILPDIHQKDAALRVHFLPEGYVQRNIKKNPEAVMYKGDKTHVAEFKVLTGERNFINHIRTAAEQADYCVIKLKMTERKKLTDAYIERRCNELYRELKLKGITVLDSNGNVIHTTN